MDKIDHDYKIKLAKAVLKATPARLAILKLLERSNTPLDVAAIIASLNKQAIKADPATVFRIMNKFTKRGLTKQVYFNEGKLRYEASSKPEHHHLICEDCGAVKDLTDCKLNSLEAEIKHYKKFRVLRHSLEFFGLCQSCQ